MIAVKEGLSCSSVLCEMLSPGVQSEMSEGNCGRAVMLREASVSIHTLALRERLVCKDFARTSGLLPLCLPTFLHSTLGFWAAGGLCQRCPRVIPGVVYNPGLLEDPRPACGQRSPQHLWILPQSPASGGVTPAQLSFSFGLGNLNS